MPNKKIHFRQCKLVKPSEGGTMHSITWLPEKFCALGKYVKLKNDDGSWTDGWKVEEVYPSRRTLDEANIASDVYRHHRKATDI